MFTALSKLLLKNETSKTIRRTIFTTHPVSNVTPGTQVCVSRKITPKDIEEFSKLTQDFNPVHSDIVHGAFLNGLVSGVIGTKLPGPGSIVISQELSFPNPCYVGDTVLVTVEIIEARKIITCHYKCISEKEQNVVFKGSAKLILKKVKNSPVL